MKIYLCPSTVGCKSSSQFLTSFVVNDTVAIDAGSIGFLDDVDAQKRIKHVLISHTHIDHIASLGSFIDNVWEPGETSPTIYCTEESAAVLRQHYFNGVIWPDVLNIPSPESPYARLVEIEAGIEFEIEGLRITAVPVNHAVPTVGYIIADTDSTFIFGADSGATDLIWREANRIGNVKLVALEVAFPTECQDRADAAYHLTPDTFAAEVNKMDGSPTVLAIHLKPAFRERIERQLMNLGLPHVEVCRPSRVYVP
ncbi:MAG: MBL fold metallo-hydrolase [Planctomycetales bacterium]|nr:MBL fold metallo-hydrolase [Planctomycetales bacterium]